QGLRDKLSQLFIFTAGQDPLFLGGTAGSDSATALHADHFIPSAVADNGSLISFISNAISGNVANVPVSATSGGSTFRFEGGVPAHENDLIQLRLALDLDMTITSFFVSFGLLDKVDIGVVVPIVSASLQGTSDAEIIPFGGTTAQHFFGGTPANPQLSTSRFVAGSATGIGDIAVRAKVTVTQSDRSSFAL